MNIYLNQQAPHIERHGSTSFLFWVERDQGAKSLHGIWRVDAETLVLKFLPAEKIMPAPGSRELMVYNLGLGVYIVSSMTDDDESDYPVYYLIEKTELRVRVFRFNQLARNAEAAWVGYSTRRLGVTACFELLV